MSLEQPQVTRLVSVFPRHFLLCLNCSTNIRKLSVRCSSLSFPSKRWPSLSASVSVYVNIGWGSIIRKDLWASQANIWKWWSWKRKLRIMLEDILRRRNRRRPSPSWMSERAPKMRKFIQKLNKMHTHTHTHMLVSVWVQMFQGRLQKGGGGWGFSAAFATVNATARFGRGVYYRVGLRPIMMLLRKEQRKIQNA